MKIIFVMDLHGDTGKYDRLFKAPEDFQADVVVNGGDMLPSGLL
jgi:Icc-related predicted phosphoesterase